MPRMPRLYRTSDFYLACFLHFQRYPLAEVDRSDRTRMVFVFDDDDDDASMEAEGFFAGRRTVDPHAFQNSIRELKSKMYDG